jgi:hypothetical protein
MPINNPNRTYSKRRHVKKRAVESTGRLSSVEATAGDLVRGLTKLSA